MSLPRLMELADVSGSFADRSGSRNACFTIRWLGAQRLRELLWVGLSWLLLTVAFEVLFGRFVVGLAWSRIAADYDVLNGGLMPLGLLLLFFSPMLAAHLRGTS